MSKSIEELLQLVKERTPGKRKPKEDSKHVLDFIKDLGIEAGTQPVPNYLIFYVYRCLWRESENYRKVKKITFFQTLGRHLPDYRHGKQRFYLIKEGLFSFTEETLKEAKVYDKQYWGKKKVSKKVQTPQQERSENAP